MTLANTPKALEWSVGLATAGGGREHNEDVHACSRPALAQKATKGILFAVADGVSGAGAGREAAEYTVRSLMSDYYATPDTWGVVHALDKVLTGLNRWLNAQGERWQERAGMSCTLSALVIRGTRYYSAHVGDSRIYRWRENRLEALTTDHVWEHPEMRHVLKRAVGLDRHLVIDYSEGEIHPGDLFLLATDGLWEPLGRATLEQWAAQVKDCQNAAEALVAQAHARGGKDDATAVVIRVDSVPEAGSGDRFLPEQPLPVPPPMASGARIDGFEVLRRLHESRTSLLYQVRQVSDGKLWVLKTLPFDARGDEQAIEALLQEEWLARRVISHYVPTLRPLSADPRSALYYVMSWHEGATLQQWLDHGRHFGTTEVIQLGIRLLKGLAVLHRLDILHRDIKPDNLHLGPDAKLRILDLGAAVTADREGFNTQAGTPSYMAPERLKGQAASIESEIYAVGVTLYHLLSRHYPYGEVEPFQHPVFGAPVSIVRYRTDVPLWLEIVLDKAVSVKPERRFSTVEEMLISLEQGERNGLERPRVPRVTPMADQWWRGVALTSLVVNLLLIYLLLASR